MLPTRRHVSYILLSLLLGAVVAEGALDVVAFAVPRVHNRLRPAWSRSFVADAELGYRAAPGAAEHDRWGFRNASVPARCDILAIGGSFTYGRTVRPVETWPRQLATVTGQPTYAMSCGGYGPCEIAALLERGLALNPRTVVIELHPASALATAYASVYGGTRFPRWRALDAGTLAQLAAADQAKPLAEWAQDLWWSGPGMHESNPLAIVDQAFLGEGFGRILSFRSRAAPLRRWLAEHSSLYGLGSEVARILAAHRPQSGSAGAPGRSDPQEASAREPGPSSPGPDYLRIALDRSDPRIREGERILKICILAMSEQLRLRGARLIVLVAPSMERVQTTSHAGAVPAVAGQAELVMLDDQITGELNAYLETHRIASSDPTLALRQSFDQGNPSYDGSSAAFPNAVGYRAVAEALAPLVMGKTTAPQPAPAGASVGGSLDP